MSNEQERITDLETENARLRAALEKIFDHAAFHERMSQPDKQTFDAIVALASDALQEEAQS